MPGGTAHFAVIFLCFVATSSQRCTACLYRNVPKNVYGQGHGHVYWPAYRYLHGHVYPQCASDVEPARSSWPYAHCSAVSPVPEQTIRAVWQ